MPSLSKETRIEADSSIVEKINNGNTMFFELLVRRHNPVLYKIARSYGFNHHDSEDLMQETHVSAYLALHKFEGRASYKTWVSRIMINKCLYKLKLSYHKNIILDDHLFGPQETFIHVMSENHTEDIISGKEISGILENVLNNIPVMYRTAFVLREVEGFSIAETAELLGISTMNVKVRLNRAKTLLQNLIAQSYSPKELYCFNLVYCDPIVKKVFESIRSLSEHNT